MLLITSRYSNKEFRDEQWRQVLRLNEQHERRQRQQHEKRQRWLRELMLLELEAEREAEWVVQRGVQRRQREHEAVDTLFDDFDPDDACFMDEHRQRISDTRGRRMDERTAKLGRAQSARSSNERVVGLKGTSRISRGVEYTRRRFARFSAESAQD